MDKRINSAIILVMETTKMAPLAKLQPLDLSESPDLKPALESRAQLAYRSIKRLIRNGTFPPGRRLPEKDVAELLKISRTPVREALNRLISEGLLAMHPGRGYAVAELDKQQILELYSLREFLEGAAARFAAQHAADPEIQSLRTLSTQMGNLDERDVDAHVTMNMHFHAAIADASHNRYLQEALARHVDTLNLVPNTTFQLHSRSQDSFTEHSAIVDAIESHDPDRAEAAAREHIRNAARIRLPLIFGGY
jgi:DNA-binding GntR family transcriptional regulator